MSRAVRYYIVAADALPEIFVKVAEAKRMMQTGEAATVGAATRLAGISRSAFYKYKDSVQPFNDMKAEHIITFYGMLKDNTGVLSHDSLGNPIGFSARTMDPSQAKYINTNDTEVFRKGEIVYNYHRAKTAARRSGKVLVCEGVTDVIAFWKAGIENAVCTLGTSCTAAQIRLLKNIAPRTVFCYDGDDPGQAATYKAAKMARQAGIDVAIVLNETGLDPDEILRKDGAKGLQELAGKEISWMEFVLSYLRRHGILDGAGDSGESPEAAAEAVADSGSGQRRHRPAAPLDQQLRLDG